MWYVLRCKTHSYLKTKDTNAGHRFKKICKLRLCPRCLLRGLGATGSRGSIDPHFFRCEVHIWCLTPHFLSGFSLSRPVNPKHNPCTCRMMLRCCPAMAREQILTESINLSIMELWSSLPGNLHHLDLSLGQFRRALKTHLF